MNDPHDIAINMGTKYFMPIGGPHYPTKKNIPIAIDKYGYAKVDSLLKDIYIPVQKLYEGTEHMRERYKYVELRAWMKDNYGPKSPLRKSPKKSSRRKSPKKSSRRKSPKKSSRRKSPKKSSRRKSPKKSSRRKSSMRKSKCNRGWVLYTGTGRCRMKSKSGYERSPTNERWIKRCSKGKKRHSKTIRCRLSN